MTERFAELSPTEFFYRNREIAGFTNPSRALYSAFRELLENSLDACELHKIPPEVYMGITLEEKRESNTGVYRIRAQDNGSGVPEREVMKAFGRVFYGSKYILRQSRGTFGLGGTLALLYGQITTQKPIRVVSSTGGDRIYSYRFLIDIERNKPKVLDRKRHDNPTNWRGTIVEFSLVGNYTRISGKMAAYMKQTAVAAPYAELKLVDPYGRLYFFRKTVEEMPSPPKEAKPHPHGIDAESLGKMIRQIDPEASMLEFLMGGFHRVGDKTARRFLRYMGMEEDRRPKDLTVEDVVEIAKAMQSFDGFLPPSPDILSPIGEAFLLEGIRKEYQPEFLEVITRPSSSYLGHSFILEAGLAFGGRLPGDRGEVRLYRYANKIPLLFDEGSDVSLKVIQDINWSYYKRPTDGPLAFFIHICSTKIPFRSLGKEFIADIPEVEREVKASVRALLRNLSKYARRRERHKRLERRVGVYYKYLPLIAEFSSKLAEKEEVPEVEELVRKVMEKHEGR